LNLQAVHEVVYVSVPSVDPGEILGEEEGGKSMFMYWWEEGDGVSFV
jgi:hypothetical protein